MIYSFQMSLFKSSGEISWIFSYRNVKSPNAALFVCFSLCFIHPSQSRTATNRRSRPRAPPPCAPSDGPTRCCTWSRSAWRAWPCSTGWRACSWRCTPPLAPSGSAGEARAGPRGTSPGVRPIPDSHHLQRDEKMRRSESQTHQSVHGCFIGIVDAHVFACEAGCELLFSTDKEKQMQSSCNQTQVVHVRKEIYCNRRVVPLYKKQNIQVSLW